MGVELLTVVLFGSLFALIFLGVPLAFALGSVAVVVGYFEWGPMALHLLAGHVKSATFNYTLVSIPFFMFMAGILNKAGVANDLYQAIHVLFGPLRGGLAVGTVLACTIIAAMSGVSAVGVLAMGSLALPAMLARGYDKHMSMGTILAGGALGQLIPPSVLGIVYSGLANLSVGQVFLSGLMPGLLLASLFIAYVLLKCWINPAAGPAMPAEERARITGRERIASLLGIVPVALLVLAVLGAMFTGIAGPTEAAAVGAVGSMVIGFARRSLRWGDIADAARETLKSTSMVIWIAIASLVFVSVYAGIGGDKLVRGLLIGTDLSPWVVMTIMMVILFLLGMVMDPIGIIFLTTPIFLPIVVALGFDPLWYGGMLIINLEISYLTPPFGYNLFYLNSVAPKGITMKDIYKSSPPFIALQGLGLLICAFAPQVITWLPKYVLGQ